jgi:hypothetical protein
MNPTLGLIERMKVIGADIERRKSNAPDRFLSHFYFGPEKDSLLVRACAFNSMFERVTAIAGETSSERTRYSQRSHKKNAEGRQTTAPRCSTRPTKISSARTISLDASALV